jgi:hypothetical protein
MIVTRRLAHSEIPSLEHRLKLAIGILRHLTDTLTGGQKNSGTAVSTESKESPQLNIASHGAPMSAIPATVNGNEQRVCDVLVKLTEIWSSGSSTRSNSESTP